MSVCVSSLELLSLFTCLLTLIGGIPGDEIGLAVVRVIMKEGSDAILPCSLDTGENIESKLFDWKKDGRKEVFFYDAGSHYNNGRSGQSEQFKDRVSHFPDELKNGNASIKIRNTKVADSGNYTCIFPRLQPERRFHIQLVVELSLKDRSGETGAAPKPYITICDATEFGVQLKCEVLGAFPQPELQWQDSDGYNISAEEPQVSEREGRFCVTLQTTVTKTTTNCFRCVAKQEEIGHMTDANITVPEKLFEDTSSKVEDTSSKVEVIGLLLGGFALGVFSVAAAQFGLVVTKVITIRRYKGSPEQRNGCGNGPLAMLLNPPECVHIHTDQSPQTSPPVQSNVINTPALP